ncbi:MAG: prepilin-type N-terminal cleavage/methylation domain-containing protein [Phycisphaerae bacterium]|nr:prepilin-type N-terminal cleavage/methylation domain-containing protein [Phycisphaerae bacterium]
MTLLNAKTAPGTRSGVPGSQARATQRGFTLIEIAIAVAIVGVGVVALMMAAGSTTRVNSTSRKMTHAVYLAGEIREWTLALPFSDQDEGDMDNPPGPDGSDPENFVDDLDDLLGEGSGITYSPPRDAQGQAIYDMTDWSQTLTLTWLNPDDLSETVADGSSDMVRVEVTVAHNGRDVLSTAWIVARRSGE